MVRAGVVRHPEEWPHGGYREIQVPAKRYRLVDRAELMELLEIEESRELSVLHRRWVEDGLSTSVKERQRQWSESIAVGSPTFLEEVKARLGSRASGRSIAKGEEGHQLKEPQGSYDGHFPPEMVPLSHENSLFWHISAYESES